MATAAGRDCKIVVEGTTVYYTTVFDQDSTSEPIGADVHGQTYKHYVGFGSLDAKVSGEYILDLADSGQNTLRDAHVTQSGISDIKFYWNAANYTQPASGSVFYVTACPRSAPADGYVSGTFEGVFSAGYEDV